MLCLHLNFTNGLVTATFYTPGLGSCGFQNTDADFIVAVDHATITSFPGAGANPNTYASSAPYPLAPYFTLTSRAL